MEKKYGKKYDSFIKKTKSYFFDDNDKLLENNRRIVELYLAQPIRNNCKMCGDRLDEECLSLISHGVKYILCKKCNHLNGSHIETDYFCQKVYIEEDYGAAYYESTMEEFEKKKKTIYEPKMDFLVRNIKSPIKILDVGAGSGYFVNAGRKKGIDIKGIEVCENQVKFGNQMLGENLIKKIDLKDTSNVIRETNRNTVTMIGVLEHFKDFHEVLLSITKNDNIKYFYFSVPLFSYSSIIEAVFPDVYNRQMSPDHTHLFTNESLKYMCEKYNFDIIASWQFGMDAMDLIRAFCVHLGKENSAAVKMIKEKMVPLIDDIQYILDKSEFSSEVHMLIQKC